MTSKNLEQAWATDKSYVEDIEKAARRRQSSTKHGDRALAIIGDDRVSLTDEDVSRLSLHALGEALSTLPYFYLECQAIPPTDCSSEQTHPPKNRQSHPCNPRLGLLSPNPRQICPWLCCHIRPPKRHTPDWQSILSRWIHCAHCATGMATLLIDFDCQSSTSHSHAGTCPRMGHRAIFNGSLSQLLGPPSSPLLPWAFRSGLSSTFQCHYKSVVSSLRATHSCGGMVRHKWPCYNCCVGPFIRTWAHPIEHVEVVANVSNLLLVRGWY